MSDHILVLFKISHSKRGWRKGSGKSCVHASTWLWTVFPPRSLCSLADGCQAAIRVAREAAQSTSGPEGSSVCIWLSFSLVGTHFLGPQNIAAPTISFSSNPHLNIVNKELKAHL